MAIISFFLYSFFRLLFPGAVGILILLLSLIRLPVGLVRYMQFRKTKTSHSYWTHFSFHETLFTSVCFYWLVGLIRYRLDTGTMTVGEKNRGEYLAVFVDVGGMPPAADLSPSQSKLPRRKRRRRRMNERYSLFDTTWITMVALELTHA